MRSPSRSLAGDRLEEDGEILQEEGEFLVWRLRRGRGDGGSDVFVVLPAYDHPAPAIVDRFVHEYELRDELDAGWAARPLELVRVQERTGLVRDDPGGEPLERLIGRPMETGRFLRRAVEIVEAVGQAHRQGLIHKDLKPAHILIDEVKGKAWLTGFGIASRIPRERPAPEAPEIIGGTLAYMAPEQTGRMNRSVDARTDLYALGVILYQMVAGVLPFTADDPMEWVYCHIARRPLPLAERVPGVPPALSAVVMKCLAKTAEDRYQTAAGLAADLKHCLEQWEATGCITPFPPGARDIPDRLCIPEKLYGRECEVATLLAAFDRVVAGGQPELVLVSGYAGIGKSSVVNELHKALVPTRGLFAAGKFDQYKRDIPYATLAQAFQGLLRSLLGKGEAEFDHWREDLRAALDPNGALMVNLVPELKLIIGDQPPVPDLPPQDAEYRFRLVFRRFIGVFARPEHPLALFLDDLQWLDAATLSLLADLATSPELRHLLLVGACRDNEVDAAHPLRRSLNTIRQAGGTVHEIILAPLTQGDVERLVADALRCTEEAARPLAGLAYDKSAGNPFFTIQFLTALADETLLGFEPAQGKWVWDLKRIRAKGYTDNVVDLMVAKLSRLPQETRDALKHFACLGNAADVRMLGRVLELSPEAVHCALWEAVRAGLVVRKDDGYAFLHDRVQEAAHSLIPVEAQAAAHLRIGRLLASNLSPDEIAERIFDVVNQFDRGCDLIEAPEERERVAELNLAAGRRALASTAYAAALSYLGTGAGLLAEDCWERRHDLAFWLEFHRAECEFLTGVLAAAEERLSALSARAADTLERALVASLRVDLYTTLDQSSRAITVGLDYLRHLGIDWSPHPTEEEVRREYDRIGNLLGSRAIEELIDLPLMSDPASLATLDVLTKLLPPALFTNANLHSLVSCGAVTFSLERGNCDGSCCAYAWLGAVASGRFGDFKTGFRFGRLGCDLVDQRGLRRFQARTYVIFESTVLPWTKHIRTGLDLLRRAFEVAKRGGDLTFAAYSCKDLNTNLLTAGDPLAEVQYEAEHGLAFARKARFGLAIDFIAPQLGLVRTLRGLTPTFGIIEDEQFERQIEQRFSSNLELGIAECWYWIYKLQARFLANDYAAAIEASSRARPLLKVSSSVPEQVNYQFFGALTCAASFDAVTPDRRASLLEALAAHERQLAIWAESCPENFENRVALVRAEIARLEGRESAAMRLYQQAIQSARGNGFVHNEALANELAARFYLDRNLETAGFAHLRNARACYAQWGAEGKLRQLDRRYPTLATGGSRLPAATSSTSLQQLDAATVIKASQALAAEIELPRLIETLMTIALGNAGADHGLLILPRDGVYWIEAAARTRSETVEVTLRRAVMEGSICPEVLLRYVIRTGKGVILDDVSRSELFSKDAYVRGQPPRSAFCLPLIRQGVLIGVLYLENSQATHAFTAERVKVLDVLAVQAAISLENSLLYQELAEREARIRRLVDANIVGIFMWDLDGRITEANEAFLDIVGYDRNDLVQGRLRWTDLTPPEWLEVDERCVSELNMHGSVPPFEKEYFSKDGRRVPVLIGVALFPDSRNQGVAFVLNLAERKEAERRQQSMVDELNHRVKNTLATVMAISAQTFRTTSSSEEFRVAFEGRLLALSQTHNLLNRTCWTGVGLRELVEQALAPYTGARGDRIVVTGRAVRLGPVMAVTLGMAFHELATNAAKYGALSVPDGRIRVNWRCDKRGRLRLDWQESGGPPVRPPTRRGFGSQLIEGVLGGELRGKSGLNFELQGVRCTMNMPLERASTH